MNVDLDDYLEAADGADVSFAGRYPEEFLVNPRPRTIPAWHLVGDNDPIDASQLTGAEPDDGYPVLLRDWIRQDGLKCLKVKLRGNDAADLPLGVAGAVGEVVLVEGQSFAGDLLMHHRRPYLPEWITGQGRTAGRERHAEGDDGTEHVRSDPGCGPGDWSAEVVPDDDSGGLAKGFDDAHAAGDELGRSVVGGFGGLR